MSDSPPVPVAAGKEDCGVCGMPATHRLKVCDGYCVPRCEPHRLDKAYQAESRLVSARELLAERPDFTKAELTALVHDWLGSNGAWRFFGRNNYEEYIAALRSGQAKLREALAVPDRGRKDTADG